MHYVQLLHKVYTASVHTFYENPHGQGQGSRKSKIGWELTKSGCHVRSPELFKNKKHIIVGFKQIIPITRVFVHFWGLLDQFGWQPPFPLAHFGWWTLISEAISAG